MKYHIQKFVAGEALGARTSGYSVFDRASPTICGRRACIFDEFSTQGLTLVEKVGRRLQHEISVKVDASPILCNPRMRQSLHTAPCRSDEECERELATARVSLAIPASSPRLFPWLCLLFFIPRAATGMDLVRFLVSQCQQKSFLLSKHRRKSVQHCFPGECSLT